MRKVVVIDMGGQTGDPSPALRTVGAVTIGTDADRERREP
jgi:hypothetical protein